MTDLTYMTASELAPLIKTKQISPVELTQVFLESIESHNPILNAYITVTSEIALQQARQSEVDIMSGNYKGDLHGIPIGIKDNYYTKGVRTTAGSKVLNHFVPKENATTVEKLFNAGAIMLGKLNMHEYGGGLTNTNPFYGEARNPWNIHYSPGGSSGGSGTALAAGLATLATGTDTFGSIRVPAAMSGIYGLKPTYGLISTYGIVPLAWSLDHPGPMARSISDLALMLNVMAGYDPKDPASLNISTLNTKEKLQKDFSNIKIGLPKQFMEHLDPDVEQLFNQTIQSLEHNGVIIKKIDIPELSMASFAGYVLMTGEASAFHEDWLKKIPENYAQDVRIVFESGILTQAPFYVMSQQIRRLMVKSLKNAFNQVDILIGPTIPIKAPRFSKNWVETNLSVIKRSMPFTVPANLTGVPSLSIPMGFCSRGLPVGMQILGDHLTDQELLRIGRSLELIIHNE